MRGVCVSTRKRGNKRKTKRRYTDPAAFIFSKPRRQLGTLIDGWFYPKTSLHPPRGWLPWDLTRKPEVWGVCWTSHSPVAVTGLTSHRNKGGQHRTENDICNRPPSSTPFSGGRPGRGSWSQMRGREERGTGKETRLPRDSNVDMCVYSVCVWHSLGSGQELTWQHGGESSSKDIIYGRETRGSILTFRHFNTRRPSQDARSSFFPLFFSFLLSSPDWCCRQGLHFISGEFHLFLSALPTIGLSFIPPFFPSFVRLFDDLLVYLTNDLSVHLFDRLLDGLYAGSFVWSFIRLIVCCFDRSSFLFINVFFVLFSRSCSSFFTFIWWIVCLKVRSFDGSFVCWFVRLSDGSSIGLYDDDDLFVIHLLLSFAIF